MTRFAVIALFALAPLAACDRGATFEQTNASTDAALNAAAENINEGDGTDQGIDGVQSKAAGEKMRSAATERPH